jgi:hypothetical protein
VWPGSNALAAGDLAAEVARREERPLRIDVWGHLFAPMRTVQQALQHAPGLDVELGPGRDLPAVISALSRGEIDAGFGRVHPADVPDGDLAHRLMRLEPVDAILGAGHPLADRDELRPADLRGSTLVFPAAASRLDFLVRFADQFGIPDRSEGPNLGFGHFIDRVCAGPRCFSLLPPMSRCPSWLRHSPTRGAARAGLSTGRPPTGCRTPTAPRPAGSPDRRVAHLAMTRPEPGVLEISSLSSERTVALPTEHSIPLPGVAAHRLTLAQARLELTRESDAPRRLAAAWLRVLGLA